jgi:sulfide:quinone oxidoreductase
MTRASEKEPAKVLIVGGGFAAVEALLALRTLMGERAAITMIASSERFAYRPAATAEAFSAAVEPPQSYDLAQIAADAGARFRRGRLEAVAPAARTVRLASDASVHYDSLVLALGARARVAIPGAITFCDQREVPRMRALLAQMREGAMRRLVFAVPSGCAWPLPLYELAMLSAAYAEEHRLDAEVSIVSPSSAPLEIFGAEASAVVRRMLLEHGVMFRGGLIPASVRHDGGLQLHFGGVVAADQVIAAPQLRGPRLAGVPSRWWGFVPVDAEGRVEGLRDVYAAGDMTTYPIKQGGLAAAQADTIARVIAAKAGVQVTIPPPVEPRRLMQARLLGAEQAIQLSVKIDADGVQEGLGAYSAARLIEPAPMHEKVNGRYLSAYLATRGGHRRRPDCLPRGATSQDAPI